MGKYKCKLCKRGYPANEIACEFDDGVLCIHCFYQIIRISMLLTIFLIIKFGVYNIINI